MWNGLILTKEKKEPKDGIISKVKSEPCKIKGQTDMHVQVRWGKNEVMYLRTTDLNKWYETVNPKELCMVIIIDE